MVDEKIEVVNNDHLKESQLHKKNGADFYDYLIYLLRYKKTLFAIFFVSLILSYLYILFTVKEVYEGSATIIPNNQSSLAGISSLMKNVSSILPIGLGSISKESDMDLYNTILFSRTSIENLIDKFDLQNLYKIKKRELAITAIRKSIVTNVTMENAYEIKARAPTPKLASDITNYLVGYLNTKIIELNIQKSKDNRLFLEQRYNEVSLNLKNAEDALKKLQEKEGIFDADNQIKASIDVYAKLESVLAQKQIELQIANQLLGKDASSVNNVKIEIQEYKRKIELLKDNKDSSSMILGLNLLPEKVLDFYRYYRDVRIYEEMLKFILPLYEQSKFEEQKNIPILQIIDKAVPPEKRVYPKRTMTAGIVAIIVVILVCTLLVLQKFFATTSNKKLLILKQEMFNFK